MDDFTRSCLLLFVLLNPFTMSVYLRELIEELELVPLARQLLRAGVFSFLVFVVFAVAGETIFENVLQVRYSSFLIFGGITFLIIGIRLIAGAGSSVEGLRPTRGAVAGSSIAIPFMVGPGTISASIFAGARLPPSLALLAILLSLAVALSAVVLLKRLYDVAQRRDARLVQRYTAVAGRVTALFTGSFAIEMILNGVASWMAELG